MIAVRNALPSPRLSLSASTAEELMTPNPISISQESSVRQAVTFLSARRISAAPVIDDAGRPVGVLSSTDLLRHQADRAERFLPMLGPGERGVAPGGAAEDLRAICRAMAADETPVRDAMNPALHAVRPETPADEVVETILGRNVRRVFVVDQYGVLVGIVSALDVLRKLRPDWP